MNHSGITLAAEHASYAWSTTLVLMVRLLIAASHLQHLEVAGASRFLNLLPKANITHFVLDPSHATLVSLSLARAARAMTLHPALGHATAVNEPSPATMAWDPAHVCAIGCKALTLDQVKHGGW